MMGRKVCIIIPTLNEEEFIDDLLESLKRNTYSEKEIIVVDDGSTDRTVEIATSKGAKVLVNDPGRRGPAYGWNRASKETDADVICILGADFLVEDEHFLDKCMTAFDDDTVAVYTAYRTIQDTLLEKILFESKGIGFEPRFMRRKDFLEIGGFPEIGVGEDVVLTQRLKMYVEEKALKERVVTDTYISGHGVHTLRDMYRQAIWYGKTSILFLRCLKSGNKLIVSIKFYSRLIYFLSFLALFFIPVSNIFWLLSVPFFILLFQIILKSFKNKYKLGKSVLFLLFGLGMFHGLILFLFKNETRTGGR